MNLLRCHPPRPKPGRASVRRGLVALCVAGALLTGTALSAAAEDDPSPPAWPTITQPAAGDDSADPQPNTWPTITRPQSSDNEDPTPPEWPQPVPG